MVLLYTGLWGGIDYTFGDFLYVEDVSDQLWSIDMSGTATALGVYPAWIGETADAFTEFNSNLLVSCTDGPGFQELCAIGLDGSIEVIKLAGR